MSHSRRFRATALGLLVCFFCVCPARLAAQGDPPNVLILIADDLGVDRVGAYKAHPDPGRTPVLDKLARDGLLFENAWSDPLCSPTRAGVLTGRYGFRTGVTDALNFSQDVWELPPDSATLPRALPSGYTKAALGKWHLSLAALSGGEHPLLAGFDHHAGTMNSFNSHGGEGYFSFTKWIDGVPSQVNEYATSGVVDDALAAVAAARGPWFLWVAFQAPHFPAHKPPHELHGFALPPSITGNVPIHVKAAIEAMDTEIGRLFSGIGREVLENTLVIFLGDNGTHGLATTPPSDPDRAKGTVFQGGVRVPLLIKGPGVAAGKRCAALVNTTDIFATVLDVVGGDASAGVDSVSLVPYFTDPHQPSLREFVYAGLADPPGFYPGGLHLRTVREARFKLLALRDDVAGLAELRLYDLLDDPDELVDLLAAPLSSEAEEAFDRLFLHLDAWVSPWTLLAGGVPGAVGLPRLRGQGALLGGETFTLVLHRTKPSSFGFLVFGFEPLMLPFCGGLIVPSFQQGGLLPFLTDSNGGFTLPQPWPTGVPPGAELYFQAWVVDTAAVFGKSASNGLFAITP